jgi:hypothetical protein
MKEHQVHSYMVLGDTTCPELDIFAIAKESSVVVESVIKHVQTLNSHFICPYVLFELECLQL